MTDQVSFESSVEIRTPTHRNLISFSMTFPSPVIAQQYSSATFLSLRLHFYKEIKEILTEV
jgi:hypothetical protein